MFQISQKIIFTTLFLAGIGCFSGMSQDAGANTVSKDSSVTPFQKGRWLTGLNGSFNSSTLELRSSDDLIATNSYALEIFSGTFFKDRWFLGANIVARSSSGNGLVDTESETLLIGPSIQYYFLNESYGSLYVSVLPGYIRLRESSTLEVGNRSVTELAEGPGFAIRTRLGFAYALSKRVILDVGVGSTFNWIDVRYDSELQQNVFKESIFANSTFFSFGFNVLLDEFFF